MYPSRRIGVHIGNKSLELIGNFTLFSPRLWLRPSARSRDGTVLMQMLMSSNALPAKDLSLQRLSLLKAGKDC